MHQSQSEKNINKGNSRAFHFVSNTIINNINKTGADSAVHFNSKSEGICHHSKESLIETYSLICAIDFGTTYSGYGYKFVGENEEIRIMKNNVSQTNKVLNHKIPSAIILNENREFHSFGYDAKTFYNELSKEESLNYHFFCKFKMKLLNDNFLTKECYMQAKNGTLHKATKIFSLSLKALKDMFFEEINSQSATKYTSNDVKWVLTVPAIWKEEAKNFMRTCAYMAGISGKKNPDSLIIALEPEAASIYCRTLKIRDCMVDDELSLEEEGELTIESFIKIKRKYIIVDCGGGTVDISIHEADYENNSLKEIKRGLGGPYGGILVDKYFKNLMQEIFGTDFINDFIKKYPSSWVDLMDNFELKKRGVLPYKNTTINIPVPYNLIKFHKKNSKSKIMSTIRKSKILGISWSEQGVLKFEVSVIRDLFLETIKNIRYLICKILNEKEMADVKYMFLVGGFSESQLLQHELRTEFNGRLKIVSPYDASLTILKGSVLFGENPGIIRVRRSVYTYGVRALLEFDKALHDLSKLININGRAFCKDYFSILVRIDQSIYFGQTVTKKFYVQSSDKTQCHMEFYRSKKPNPYYTTEDDVELCGYLRVDTKSQRDNDEILIEIYFGESELKVTSKNITTNKFVEACFEFLYY